MGILLFIGGIFVGVFVGVVVMALCNIASKADRMNDEGYGVSE